jgi:hypothetical protein
MVGIVGINGIVQSIKGRQSADCLPYSDRRRQIRTSGSKERMQLRGFIEKDRVNGRNFLYHCGQATSYRDEALPMVGHAIVPEVKNRGSDGITEGMQAAGKQRENVFRFAMLVPDDRVFHPANVFQEKPVGLQGLDDFDPR